LPELTGYRWPLVGRTRVAAPMTCSARTVHSRCRIASKIWVRGWR